MKKKNLTASIMTVALVAGLLSGCGSSSQTSASTEAPAADTSAEAAEATEAAPAASGEKTTIKLWHYFSTEGSQEKFQEYVDEFNAQSDTTQVEVTVLPYADFKKQLTVGAAASSLPDLAMIDNCDTVSFAAMGILEDVTEEVSSWEITQKYFPEIMATCTYEDKIYGMPLESNNLEIIYNKAIFDEMGVDYPENDWTFEDLKSIAQQVTNDQHYGFAVSGIQSEESTYQLLPFFWTAGGESMQLDSEAGKTALSLWADMINDGSMPRDCLTWTQAELASQFQSGNVAMHVMGCWNLGPYKNNGVDFGVVEVPSATEGGEKVSVYGGENLCVIAGKNTANALEFLEWFEQYDRISEWDYCIDHFAATEESLTDERFQTPEWKPFIDMIPNSRARDVVTYWPNVSEGYQLAIQEALSGQQTVEQALKDGQAIIDEAIADQ